MKRAAIEGLLVVAVAGVIVLLLNASGCALFNATARTVNDIVKEIDVLCGNDLECLGQVEAQLKAKQALAELAKAKAGVSVTVEAGARDAAVDAGGQ